MTIIPQTDLTSILMNSPSETVTNTFGAITELHSIDGKSIVRIGDIINSNMMKAPLKASSIIQVNKGSNSLWKIQHSRRINSYHFGLPLLYMQDESLTKFTIGCNVIISTAFIGHKDYLDTENLIYIMVRNIQELKYLGYQKTLEDSSAFVGLLPIDKYYDLYVMEITSPELIEQFKLLKAGKYSKISDVYKKTVLDNVAPGEIRNYLTYGINKDPILKKFLEDKIGTAIDADSELLEMPSTHDVFDPVRDALPDEISVTENLKSIF